MNRGKDKVIFLRHALSAINYEKKVLAEAGMMEELKRLKAGMDRKTIFMDPSVSEEGFEQIHAIGRYNILNKDTKLY